MATPRYVPGAADIVGSLDTRQPAGRYGDVEAITPNTDITPEGAAKSAKVFAPLEPREEGVGNYAERVAEHHEAVVLGENVASNVSGSGEVGSQVPVGGHRILKDGEVESEPVAGEEGDFEPHDDESAKEALDEHQNEGKTDEDGDGKVSTSEGGDADGEGETYSTDPLPEGWKDLTNEEQLTLAQERGVEGVNTGSKKAELIGALGKWEKSQQS